jgi:hypothetical protein
MAVLTTLSCIDVGIPYLSIAKDAMDGARLEGRAVMQATAFWRSTLHILRAKIVVRRTKGVTLCAAVQATKALPNGTIVTGSG